MTEPSINPRVSVVIPTFNRPEGLRRAVEAVLGQNFDDFELIIVDDFSTAETEITAKSYQDPRVVYFRQSKNVGITKNWGTGVQLARGEYICLLMDDDYYKPSFLTRRVATLDLNPEALFAFSDFTIAEEGNADSEQQSIDYVPRAARLLKGPELLHFVLAKRCFVGTMMYRTAELQAIWPQLLGSSWIVDFAANLRFALRTNACAVYLDGSDFVMSRHPGQISHLRQTEVFALASDELNRQLCEPHPKWARSLIRAELTNWLTLWARISATNRRRWQAIRLLIRAATLQPLRLATWRQIARTATGITRA